MKNDLDYSAVFGLAFQDKEHPAHTPYGLQWLTGLTGEQALPILSKAIERMDDPTLRTIFESIASPLTLNIARNCLTTMAMAARLYPKGTWKIQ